MCSENHYGRGSGRKPFVLQRNTKCASRITTGGVQTEPCCITAQYQMCFQDIVVYLKCPRRSRKKIVCTTAQQGHVTRESGLSSLEQGECTTAIQGHVARESRLSSLERGECTTAQHGHDRARRRRGGEGEGEGGEKERTVLKNRTSLKG